MSIPRRRSDLSLDDSHSQSSVRTNLSADSTSNDLHVLVIGAGITGLLIGQALRKAGYPCTIFESEPCDGPSRHDWTIAIHWSLPYVQNLLPEPLYIRLNEAYCDPSYEYGPDDGVPIYNGETGDLLKKVPANGMIRISRRRMRTLCSEGLAIRHEKTLMDIAYGANGTGVKAHFADGTTVEGGIIVGADGAKSKVRELLLGTEKAKTKTLGLNFNSFLVKYNDARKSKHVRSNHPVTCLAYHPDGIFSFISAHDVPDNSLPETWSFQLACSWFGERDSSLATVNQKMQSFVEPFRSAFAWIPQDTSPNNGAIRYWVPISWDNHGGRVTLAGDAAHPLPPHRGQGLNVSISDVSDFCDAIARVRAREASLAEAVGLYDIDLVKRGVAEVNISVETTRTAHDWLKLMESPLMQRGLTRS